MGSISCHIIPLVINSLVWGRGHTHTHTRTHTVHTQTCILTSLTKVILRNRICTWFKNIYESQYNFIIHKNFMCTICFIKFSFFRLLSFPIYHNFYLHHILCNKYMYGQLWTIMLYLIIGTCEKRWAVTSTNSSRYSTSSLHTWYSNVYYVHSYVLVSYCLTVLYH